MSELLDKARRYEAENAGRVRDTQPLFHMTAAVGWMNDPNGFSWYKGQYHLFYQYNPYDNVWGPMHWGHCVSDDLIRWERLPAIMAPDEEYDDFGVFSGSAIVEGDRHILMYTSVHTVMKDGKPGQLQLQSVAEGDGENYVKWDCNPVIRPEDLPEGCSTEDFRDPKLWKDGEEYRVVLANRGEDGSGQILLYTSPDLRHWTLLSRLARSEGRLGGMWECPDFFPLDGKHVLITSLMDLKPTGREFRGGSAPACFIGSFDRETGAFDYSESDVRAVDYGFDFYAPQSMETPDGRRVMTAWMYSWDSSLLVPGAEWAGQMTVPRELFLKDGRLCQRPVRELENYRGEKASAEAELTREFRELPGIRGRIADLTVTLEDADRSDYCLRIAADGTGECFTEFRYSAPERTLTLDRRAMLSPADVNGIRVIDVEPAGGKLTLRFILDKYSAELFIGEGEKAASLMILTDPAADGILFAGSEGARVSAEIYGLSL